MTSASQAPAAQESALDLLSLGTRLVVRLLIQKGDWEDSQSDSVILVTLAAPFQEKDEIQIVPRVPFVAKLKEDDLRYPYSQIAEYCSRPASLVWVVVLGDEDTVGIVEVGKQEVPFTNSLGGLA